jgi:Restriction alleviation protein Lar
MSRQFEFLQNLREHMKDELPATKPCPFCGNPYTDLEGMRSVTVVCSKCKAEGPSVREDDPYSAIRVAISKWNERV